MPQKLLAAGEADRIDGYLVYQMNNWVQVMQTIVASGKPTLVADFPYAGSGGFLVYTAGLRRTHKNFSVVASSKIEDLAAVGQVLRGVEEGWLDRRVRRRLRPRAAGADAAAAIAHPAKTIRCRSPTWASAWRR